MLSCVVHLWADRNRPGILQWGKADFPLRPWIYRISSHKMCTQKNGKMCLKSAGCGLYAGVECMLFFIFVELLLGVQIICRGRLYIYARKYSDLEIGGCCSSLAKIANSPMHSSTSVRVTKLWINSVFLRASGLCAFAHGCTLRSCSEDMI